MSLTVNRTRSSAATGMAFAYGPWPDYNEEAMAIGLESTFRYFDGEPFCHGSLRPA